MALFFMCGEVMLFRSYFTRLFSWLLALAGLDFPMRLPVGFFLPPRFALGPGVCLIPLIIFSQIIAGQKVPVVM